MAESETTGAADDSAIAGSESEVIANAEEVIDNPDEILEEITEEEHEELWEKVLQGQITQLQDHCQQMMGAIQTLSTNQQAMAEQVREMAAKMHQPIQHEESIQPTENENAEPQPMPDQNSPAQDDPPVKKQTRWV